MDTDNVQQIHHGTKIACSSLEHKEYVLTLADKQGFRTRKGASSLSFLDQPSMFFYFRENNGTKVITSSEYPTFFAVHDFNEVQIHMPTHKDNPKLRNLKINDKVYCNLYGEGTVVWVGSEGEYPIFVNFNHVDSILYNTKGQKIDSNPVMPTLTLLSERKCLWEENDSAFYRCSHVEGKEWNKKFKVPDFCPHCGKPVEIKTEPYLLNGVEVAHPVLWEERSIKTDYVVLPALNKCVLVDDIPTGWAPASDELPTMYEARLVRRSKEEAEAVLEQINLLISAE